MQARHRCLSHAISTDVKVARLSCAEARLLFTWMIAHADNLGRMRGEAPIVRLTVLPHEKVSDRQVETWLLEMHHLNLIQRYHIDGITYIQLLAWNKHQRLVGNMKRDSDFPPYIPRTNGVHTASLRRIDGVSPEGEGEVEVEEEEKICAEPQAAPAPVVIVIPTNRGGEHPITEGDVAEWRAAYPAVDVLGQLRAARAWCQANPKHRKTPAGVKRFLNGWLARTQNSAVRLPDIHPREPTPRQPSAVDFEKKLFGEA